MWVGVGGWGRVGWGVGGPHGEVQGAISLDHRDPIRPQPRVLTHSCISFVMCFGIRKRPLSTG